MKRKYADRPNWKRVLGRRSISENIQDIRFRGRAVLTCIDKVREPLWVDIGDQRVCVADAGYSWLTLFPENQKYVVTVMFNRQREAVQWYIDICKNIGITDSGVPWYDDLYLDIIISAEGNAFLIDEDDLSQALEQNIISKQDYDFAYAEANQLLKLIYSKQFTLLDYSKEIFMILLDKIEGEKQ